ncbi:hypothetical protein CCHR01_11640 [Colletotrichum chrysophilum]|uniref:Uncharacterized protein n=1 Tax=Colletotrichum chrysophilum TaxID=1836956 RepID=A0AAD9EC52_9PEZI|nr:hypothetical protein CCHR01_11640 [Colletotrichum chrysophilum]
MLTTKGKRTASGEAEKLQSLAAVALVARLLGRLFHKHGHQTSFLEVQIALVVHIDGQDGCAVPQNLLVGSSRLDPPGLDRVCNG